MTYLRHVFIRHGIAVLAASALVFLIIAPFAAFPLLVGNSYHGINIAHISDEYIYLTRTREALEGHRLGQPVLAEGKDMPDVTFSYVEKMLVFPLRLSGLSERVNIVTYVNVVNALGIFILALLMYAFIFRLSGDRLVSVAAVTFAIGGYTVSEAHTLFYNGFNIYGRSMFPFASSIPLFAFLICLHDILVRRRGGGMVALAGVLLGAMCYIYFYAWTFSFALVAALLVIYALLRDWRSIRALFLVGITGLVVGSCNLFALFTTTQGPLFKQLSYFYFSIQSHAFVMSNAGLIALLLFFFVLWRRGSERQSAFVAGMIATGWIVLNQQMVTGRMLQYGHYFWYFVSPLCIMLSLYLVWRLLPKRITAAFSVALIMLGFAVMTGQQYRSFHSDLPVKLREQEYHSVITALQGMPYGVVLNNYAQNDASFLVTIYTHDDLYWNSAAESYIFPIDRLKEVLLLHLYLNTEARGAPKAFLEKELSAHAQGAYTGLYTELEGFYSGYDYREYQRRYTNDEPSLVPVREKLLRELLMWYEKDFSDATQVRALLQERNVRYVLWDTAANPEWDLSPLHPKEIAHSGSVTLYSIGD